GNFLKSEADSETALPVMSREAAGFECWNGLGSADCPPCIAHQTVAKIESEYQTPRGEVFNDAAQIEIEFRTRGSLVREEVAPWVLNTEWVTGKMHEARSRLQENTFFAPTFSRLYTKESLEMITTGSRVPRQKIKFGVEI